MTAHPIDRDDARFGAEAHLRYGGGGDDLAENVLALLDLLAAAEHRATRAEAQSAIRGRAVVIYRDRAREAEARVKAVRAIHRDLYESMSGVPYCDECDRAWPCPTIRALDA